MINKIDIIRKNNKQIKKLLRIQYDIWPSNPILHLKTCIYLKYLDFRNNSLKHYIDSSKLVMKKLLKKEDVSIDVLKKNSCVIFISLLDPIGEVKSVSKQF